MCECHRAAAPTLVELAVRVTPDQARRLWDSRTAALCCHVGGGCIEAKTESGFLSAAEGVGGGGGMAVNEGAGGARAIRDDVEVEEELACSGWRKWSKVERGSEF